MKKIIFVFLCCAMLTSVSGCKADESSNAASSGGSTDSAQVAQDRLNEDYDGLTADLKTLFTKYYDGIHAQDFDACFSVFPDFYVKKLEAEITSKQSYIDAANDWFSEEYGTNYTVSLSFGQIFQLTDDSLATYHEILSDTYDVDVEIEDGYTVTLNETGSGTLGTNTLESEWYVFVIDGTYYLYDTYFETQ